ncbi:bacteriocin-like protein [Chryseobacterium indoltheticum]|uniref:bacteriocin-like protein n=1 Tax=Chryseobacterium indoltheticum TaxID=254 RepID=UPI003F494B82
MKKLKKLSRKELKALIGGNGVSYDLNEDTGEGSCPSKCTVTQGEYTTHGTCSKGQGTYSNNCYCSADSAGATLSFR